MADAPQPTLLDNYRAPEYLIDEVDLRFDLHEHHADVESVLRIRRNPAGDATPGTTLVLDGNELRLLGVELDGRPLTDTDYTVTDETLTIASPPEQFELKVRTAIEPQNNTALEGLYRSGAMFCTQCEAEGFRKITYYLDRPDVMARFRTTIIADASAYPVLLSNGNCIDQGESDDGRHWVTWTDPYPKPSYLFALVAGELSHVEDTFTTASGRDVTLRIYVEPHNADKCAHAMDSLKASMRWDEEVYGLEYDLDIFMIVAVDSFNMGAMENKGLNIFNSKYVLADQETATDNDYKNIESIIAHEYFHNWTGNRVTCRDWFQLSLKEGLTVFRDQEFSGDIRSRALARIGDVRVLRNAQFKEDAGPTAHPVRPESYLEINNFYTVTIYNKGAEVIRMIHTLLGPAQYRAGIDEYFARHDGQAVTTDDFVTAMEVGSGQDLTQFKRWYRQAGTPTISVSSNFDAAENRYELTLSQSCAATPDGSPKEPFHIPIALGLLDGDGQTVTPRGHDVDANGTMLLALTEPCQTFTFEGVSAAPIPSVMRGFSAPVKVDFPRADAELAFLMEFDSDEFNRWDAGQEYAMRLLLRGIEAYQTGEEIAFDPAFGDALRVVLRSQSLDQALVAEMLSLPAESFIAEQMDTVDPDAIHAVRNALRVSLATQLHPELERAFAHHGRAEPYVFDTEPAARRMLANVTMSYLAELDDPGFKDVLERRYLDADNMTTRMAALECLSRETGPHRDRALAHYESTWGHDPLVLDKWFALQATSSLPNALDNVRSLMSHPKFDLRNPNRVRALVGMFCQGNPVRFHDASGAGYAYLGDQLLALDPLNPQVAARLAGAFLRWRKFDAARQAHMESEMRRVLSAPNLSKDCYEILSKALSA